MKLRRLMSLSFCFLLVLVLFASSSMADNNNFFLNENQVRTYAGDVSGAIQEKHLYQQSGSNTAIEAPVGGWGGAPAYLTKRWADGTGWFTYRLPIASSTSAPLYLSMVTKGEVKMTVAGNVLLNTGNSGEGDYTAREFKLTNSADWSNGYIEVKFEDADPADGWGPNLYWMELGKGSRWQERLKYIHWDTTKIVWNVGYPDGYASEFRGTTTDFTVGGDISTLQKDGTIKLRWNQSIDSTKKYYFLAGMIARLNGGFNKVDGTDYIDIGDNGSNEIAESTGGEKVYDIDITSQVLASGNVVKLSLPTGARYDFFAVIEVSPTPVTDMNSLRISFGGNEQAVNFSKLINYSMLHTLDLLNYENSGLIDASPMNGEFWNSYWIADIGPGVTEIFKWGYLDRTRETLAYTVPSTDGHYESDTAAGNLIFNTMANLMRADNLSAATQTSYWNRLKNGMNRLMQYVDDNAYGLVYGTNWETSSDSLGIYSNSTSYVALKNAADIANRLGYTFERDNWNNYAQRIYDGMNNHLRWTSNTTWLAKPMTKGTWKYGINRNGTNPTGVRAAWHSVGSQKDGYFGLKEDVSLFRDVSNYTLDTHRDNFWTNWKAYGNNKGFGTDYGVLSERGGWPLNSLLEADRMAEAKKNLEHIIFNSTDMNFAPKGPNPSNQWDNAGDFMEYSPWDIIRETDPQDKGSSSLVGNGAGNEDLNLVEYILFLKNARIMAGVDDALYGSNNLVLIPRLPWGWDRVNVEKWPVTYKNGTAFARTNVTYNMTVEPKKATMNVSAGTSISGVQMRLGPFDPTATVSSVTVAGAGASYTTEVKGDARWVWVTTDIGTTSKAVVVNLDVLKITASYNFDTNSLAGYTSNGGTWSASGGKAKVTSTGDAWNIAVDTVGNHSVSADVKLVSGNAAGVSIRTNSTGANGYDLILDRVDGLLKLVKRPYAVLASTPVNVSLQRTYNLELLAHGSTLEGYLNGVKVLEKWDTTYTSGQHGLFAYNSTSEYDNVVVKSVIHDNFAGPLGSAWTWQVPLAGPAYSFTSGKFRLNVPNTNTYDSWTTVDNAPKLSRTDMNTGNWTMETKVDLVTYTAGQNFHTGLFVKFANNDYLFWGNYKGNSLALERSGIPGLGYVGSYTSPTVYLRIRKSGTAYFVDYKANSGDAWTNAASYFHGVQPLSGGVMSKTWSALNNTTDFDSFTLNTNK
ncbi:MAG TPA: hypothetical protein VGE40_12275 [Bacilli bacterium]